MASKIIRSKRKRSTFTRRTTTGIEGRISRALRNNRLSGQAAELGRSYPKGEQQ